MTLATRNALVCEPPLEKAEQRVVIKLLRLAGFRVGSTSQYRASGQMVGLPDLVLMHPGLKRAGFFEVKRYEAKGYRPLDRSTWKPKPLRPEQELFRQDALACGLIYGFGGIREAEQLLVELGLAEDVGNGGIILKARCFQPHVEQRLKASL